MDIDQPTYYRRDQKDGLSPPDLSKECTYVQHIVRARGKRTQLTSVSLDKNKITDFGPQLYRLNIKKMIEDCHCLIPHNVLIDELRKAANASEKAEKAQAIQAQRYAIRRKEGLVKWHFNISSIQPSELIAWAYKHVQVYFIKS